MRKPRIWTLGAPGLAAAALTAAMALPGAASAEETAAATAEQQPPAFTEEMLSDPDNIAVGEAIWHEQCAHCHGAKAYPGKAPKLKPSRYKPEFVYHRVSKGFRGMPAWGEVYSQDEIIGVVAYVKSHQFSP